MTFIHSRDTYISAAGSNLSPFTNSSELERGGDKHDITMYGADDYSFSGGLLKGSFKMSGTYDSTAAGPRAILLPLVGTIVAIIRRPEGTGSGLPQDSFSALLEKYVETNPVADMIAWSCECTVSGPVNTDPQT
jgi:hypothetical protein